MIDITEIKNILQNIRLDKPKFRFLQFNETTNNYMLVEFMGHEVGGSYVYDYQVAPEYVLALNSATNRIVEWLGRRGGGFGYDIYKFKIYFD